MANFEDPFNMNGGSSPFHTADAGADSEGEEVQAGYTNGADNFTTVFQSVDGNMPVVAVENQRGMPKYGGDAPFSIGTWSRTDSHMDGAIGIVGEAEGGVGVYGLTGLDSDTNGIGVFGRNCGGTPLDPAPGSLFPAAPEREFEQPIGVAGESAKGVGVYGITSDTTSFGVVGRANVARADTALSLSDRFRQTTGVLGHSANLDKTHLGQVGVRGHVGPLPEPLDPGDTTPKEDDVAWSGAGGVFSNGFLQYSPDFGELANQPLLSNNALAQMRLVPAHVPRLPKDGRLGDFFTRVRDDEGPPQGDGDPGSGNRQFSRSAGGDRSLLRPPITEYDTSAGRSLAYYAGCQPTAATTPPTHSTSTKSAPPADRHGLPTEGRGTPPRLYNGPVEVWVCIVPSDPNNGNTAAWARCVLADVTLGG